MKKILLIIFTIISLATPLYAADYYIAQSAAGDADATSCANAKAIADLTWGDVGMGVAGNTIHLCGTITSTLTIGASGSAGHPITIKFEDDAKFSKPAWGTTSAAAIYSVSKNYITIDGGTNGIIENTNNGTALGTKQDTNAIYVVWSSNWTIKNLTVKTMYVRTPDSDDSNTYGKGIYIIASNTIVLSNLKVSDIYHGIQAYASGSNADGLTIQNTSISRVSAGIAVSLNSAHNYTNVSIDNVTLFDFHVWDGCWNSCASWHHNDGIHTWGNYGSGANKIQITIKNSTIGGDFGAHTTALIALTDYTTDANIYNNLLYSTAEGPTNGYIGLHTYSAGTVNIYNNTIKGPMAGSGGGMGVYIGASGVWTTNIKNNIFSTMSIGIYDSGADATIVSDYNDFFNIPNIGKIGNTYYPTIASWKALTYDAHSISSDPKFVSSSDFSLQEGSPAIGAGDDSVSTYFTNDILGNARADYDIGAYEYNGTADTTPPTISSATINAAGDTLTLVFTEVVTVNTSTGFTLGMSGGAAGLTYTSGSGTNTLVYAITGRNIDTAETGTLDYVTVANGIEDAAGNDLASTGETDIAVTNNSEYTPSATTYIVTVQSSGNCTVSPLTNKVIVSGETASYTCAANGNSGCAAWTGTCGGTGTTSFTSSAVTGNCTVIQGCYKISPDVAIGSGAAVTLGTGAVGTLY